MTTNIKLTEEEVRLVLVRARYNKIKHIQWSKGSAWDASWNEDVTLTKEEEDSAINGELRARENRELFRSIRQSNRDRIRLEREALEAKWDYAMFYRLMRERARERGTDLIWNEQTAPIIKTICFRLAGDPRYETELGFSFQKGLMIRGSVGLGKSFTMQLVADNPLRPVQFVTMHEIYASILQTDKDQPTQFRGLKFASYSFVYLDDVGSEFATTKKIEHYGRQINWFTSWFEEYYAKSKAHVNRLIFSTNDSFDSLEAKYGFRVRDRLAETFDVLDLYGQSMRRNHV